MSYNLLTSQANLVPELGPWLQSLQVEEDRVGLEKPVFRHDLSSQLGI